MKLKEITLGRGTSIEVNGNWHKFNVGLKSELEDGDTKEEVKEKMWNTIDDILIEKIDQLDNPAN